MRKQKIWKSILGTVLVASLTVGNTGLAFAAENTAPENLTVGMNKDQSTITPFT